MSFINILIAGLSLSSQGTQIETRSFPLLNPNVAESAIDYSYEPPDTLAYSYDYGPSEYSYDYAYSFSPPAGMAIVFGFALPILGLGLVVGTRIARGRWPSPLDRYIGMPGICVVAGFILTLGSRNALLEFSVPGLWLGMVAGVGFYLVGCLNFCGGTRQGG